MNDDVFTTPEIELWALQAMMRFYEPSNEHLINAFDILDVDCFTSWDKRAVFDEMRKLHIQGFPISHADLINPLCAVNGELLYFINSINEPCTITSLTYWCEQLVKYRQKRRYNRALRDSLKILEEKCIPDDWESGIDTLSDSLIKIKHSDLCVDSEVRTAKQCVERSRISRANNQAPVSTGFTDLDDYLKGGFRKGTLVVIGAPPSAGKTELSTRLLVNINSSHPDKEAIIFSLEMREEEITDKLIEHMTKLPIERLSDHQRYEAEEALAKTNIMICDKSPVTVEFIKSVCKRAQMRNGISVVVVDFLDKLAKPKGDLRSDEKLTEIASQLKNIAKEYNCVVILLTQLNKAAINRPDKRPNMNDSKNSNGAAENSDYWLGIKRIGQWDLHKKYPDSNLVEIIIDKNRFGSNGICYLNLNYHMYQEINQDFARQLVYQSNSQRKEDDKIDYTKSKHRVADYDFDDN